MSSQSDADVDDHFVRPKVVGAMEDGAGDADGLGRDAAARVDMGSELDSDDEGETGQRKVEKMINPRLPTKEERLEHEKTHLPYRNWCRHCVRGRDTAAGHKASTEKPEIPELHMDYMFMGDEGEDEK